MDPKTSKNENEVERESIDINNTVNVRQVLADEINDLRTGKSNPAKGNAIANLSGKILQSVKLDIEVHRYVSSDAGPIRELSTNISGKGKLLK